MDNAETRPAEDFPQLLKRLKEEYDVTEQEIGDAIGVHVSTVNTWVNRKRKPRPAALRALAEAFPKFTEAELFAATDRATPGDLGPAAEERILGLIRGLTAEQQHAQEAQLRALAEWNAANEGRSAKS
ncbi:helix-turn-helix transcriptional regulator [Streptomyces sp. S1D4-20]|uniref:helix-turn-helix domain-containing protein n=1 Tax=Streptomyces sp. S1D4-20 TaxID=2594462 RepID=UPI0011622013|nr:helix-turn-helix transcriptional regulator [Streptomyces sp. S1D4-20]QDN57333.1 helix-turn-helix domain-containing protein [Streptomyces sp. S1D4-20]